MDAVNINVERRRKVDLLQSKKKIFPKPVADETTKYVGSTRSHRKDIIPYSVKLAKRGISIDNASKSLRSSQYASSRSRTEDQKNQVRISDLFSD